MQNENHIVTIICPYNGSNVVFACEHDDWYRHPMIRINHIWTYCMIIPRGNYEYKFIVDGEWKHDINKETTKNSYGTLNNILRVDHLYCDEPFIWKFLFCSPHNVKRILNSF